MMKFTQLCMTLGLMMGVAAGAVAGEKAKTPKKLAAKSTLQRVNFEIALPDGAPPVAPMIEGQPMPVVEASPAMSLYHCVRVKDRDNIADCAVPMIVAVPDPCPCDCCDPCGACHKKCVYVEICVPACACPCIKCKGNKVKYDYGDCSVEITSRKGVITVDYDD